MKKQQPTTSGTNANKAATNPTQPKRDAESFEEVLQTYLKPREVFSIDDGKHTLVVDCFKYTAAIMRKRNLHLKNLSTTAIPQQQSKNQKNNNNTNNNNNSDSQKIFNRDDSFANRNLGVSAPLLNLDDSNSQITTQSQDDDDSKLLITVTRKKTIKNNEDDIYQDDEDDDNLGEQQHQQQLQENVSSTIKSNSSNNNASKKNNNPLLVPDFNLVTTFFLSHFHSDHYDGLTDSFKAGNIFCSPITAALVRSRWPQIYNRRLINVLELEEYYRIDLRTGKFADRGHPPLRTRPLDRNEVDVICVDANHCPGAVMFVFHSLLHGVVVHTGDFRYNGESPSVEHEALMAMRRSNQEVLDTLALPLKEDYATQQQKQQQSQTVKKEGQDHSSSPSKQGVNAFSMMMNPNRNSEMFANSGKKGTSVRIAPGLGPSVKRTSSTSLTMPVAPQLQQQAQQRRLALTQQQQQQTQKNTQNSNHNHQQQQMLTPEQRERQIEERLRSTLPRQFPFIDKPNKRIGDASALQAVKGRVAILYIDNTFCDPKYAFPPQPEILNEACADVGKRIGQAVKNELRSDNIINKNNNNHNIINARRVDEGENDDDDNLLAHNIDNMVRRNDQTMMMMMGQPPQGHGVDAAFVDRPPPVILNHKKIIRIAISVGAYAIGKERVAISLHSAFGEKLKFLVSPNRAELLKCCQMPILDLATKKRNKINENAVNNQDDQDNTAQKQFPSSSSSSAHVYVELDPDQHLYSIQEASSRLETQRTRHENFIKKFLRPNNAAAANGNNNTQNQQQHQGENNNNMAVEVNNNNTNNNNNNLHRSLEWESPSLKRIVDPEKFEVSLNSIQDEKQSSSSSSANAFWRAVCDEFSIPIGNNHNNNNNDDNNHIDVRVCGFICDMGAFSYPSVSQSLTGNECFDANHRTNTAVAQFEDHTNNTQKLKKDRTLSPAIFSLNEFFSIDLNDFDFVLSVTPTGWANTGARGRDSSCKQVTMVGIPYSEHSSYTQLLDFVGFLQPEKIVPHVSVAQYRKLEPEFLKRCKRLKIEHGSGVPLTRHFEVAAKKVVSGSVGGGGGDGGEMMMMMMMPQKQLPQRRERIEPQQKTAPQSTSTNNLAKQSPKGKKDNLVIELVSSDED